MHREASMLSRDDKKSLDALMAAAKAASLSASRLNTNLKNAILHAMAAALVKASDAIVKENAKDIKAAKAKGLSAAVIDRLTLSPERIKGMAKSITDIAALPDPVGEIMHGWKRPNGIAIRKVRVPIGVIAIVYESRPNVTADCAALCLKSSNIVILRGGSDAFCSNVAIVKVLREAAKKHFDGELFFFIENTDRESVDHLLKKGVGAIDVVIPRGGKSLIKKVSEVSRIPVIKHYDGVCHVYVDQFADIENSLEVVFNAKVQRPSVCNAMECLLVHEEVAPAFLPLVYDKLSKAGVEFRACEKSRAFLPKAKKATKADFGCEFLDLVLAVKTVASVDEAIAHINTFGSGHTDAIMSDFAPTIKQFTEEVLSACVFVNISTRFNDGGEFGFGAEMGISTDKLHARGPVGLAELTTYKYIATGEGQVRA
jgi:glutamate-5-semialdehyde dehydrogenase